MFYFLHTLTQKKKERREIQIFNFAVNQP